MIAKPCRWTRLTQPLVAVARRAPTAGAAKRRPSTPAPPNRSAIAGKSAIGMPKNMAIMSTPYVPRSSSRLQA